MAYQDLLKDTSTPINDNNYFNLILTDLDPNTSYPIQLRWKYKDGTFSPWSAIKRLNAVTVAPAPSIIPSIPTVKPVVGAIELAWDGKTATGADQPYGFNSAKVYIGTTSNFTPIDSGTSKNQVDILNFADGQNTINIGVDTIVNSSFTLTYGIDYYVKIKTTNGNTAEDSVAVAATGNPVRIGQLSDSGLIEVKADKITTGTLQSNSTITVGSTSGKHVVIRGTGNPLSIYGSGGFVGGTILDFDATGNLSIKGTINATSGAFTGAISINGIDGAMKIGKSVGKKSDALGLTDPIYDGIYMGVNNYWYNDGIFKVGNGNKNLTWDSNNLTINNTGYVTQGSRDPVTGEITPASPAAIQTTLSSNGLFSIIAPNDYGLYRWTQAGIDVGNAILNTYINAGQIKVMVSSYSPFGIIGSTLDIFAGGDGTTWIDTPESYGGGITWPKFNNYSGYNSDTTYGIVYAGSEVTRDQSRSLVVDVNGVMFLGHRNYYGARSSTSMAGATMGVDGDFYYSTNQA